MKILGKTSIRTKLMLMLLLTSFSALMLSTISFALHDWLSHRSAMFNRLQTQAQIIGNNSLAALAFADAESANNTLASLKNEEDIVAAVLFNSERHVFAAYRRDASRSLQDLPAEQFGQTNDGNYFVALPVELDGNIIGHIMMISDFRYWKERQMFHLLIAVAVLLVSLLLALLISSRLQRLVSEPILKLAETARRVSEQRDYSLRAKKLSADEIGTLVDDFNDMLRQIQLRDHELQNIRDQLEQKVEARTLELIELTKQLEHQAYHDTLTGLANRITFDDRLRLAIDQSKRHGQRLAVMFLDLDRFKVINDTLGHAVGDKLLIEVARRLTACLRDCDTLARLGGDEFAVLLMQIRHDTDAADVARKLIEAIAKPIQVDGYSLHVTTSIGISLYPNDGEMADVIVKNADTAMYRSKDRGRNQYTFFSSEMNARALRRLDLETKLRQAIEQNVLTVYYQPRRDCISQAIVGVEALACWHDATEGFISPEEFIPLAEECGLIAAIDEWILERACQEMLPWCRHPHVDMRLAVNLSPAQFIRKDLFEVIAAILQKTGFPGERLELEITESLFGPGSVDACALLEQLRQLGIELSIDDFGTAYSSLSRLKQLPLHTLKIDKSFVRDLGHDPDDEILVRTIIAMAHSLNLKVVAEGVETEAQYEYVKKYGCDAVQGFLFGRPVPYHELEPLLRSCCEA